MKLLEVLTMLDRDDVPLDKIIDGDIRPDSIYRVNICYMCEEETWIKTYAGHPILVPLYNAEVKSFAPSSENTLDIWIDQKDWIQSIK